MSSKQDEREILSGFKREADMLRPIANDRKKIVSLKSKWETYYEIQTRKGVADVVFAMFRHEVLDRRATRQLRPIEEKLHLDALLFASQQRFALKAINGQSSAVTASEVSQATGSTSSYLSQQVLPALQEMGWLERVGRGKWLCKYEYECPTTSLYAIEVKRGDWQRALGQAVQYTTFANKSFIALDASRMPRARKDMLKSLDYAGIGLISVSADRPTDALEVILNPARRNPRINDRSLLGERILAIRQEGANSGAVGHVFGKWITTSFGEDPRRERVSEVAQAKGRDALDHSRR